MIIRIWTAVPVAGSEDLKGVRRSRTNKLQTPIYSTQDGPPAIWRRGSKSPAIGTRPLEQPDVIGSKSLTRFEQVRFFDVRAISAN